MLRKVKIEVEEFGSVRADEGELLLVALNRAGIDLHNDCGGNLKCGKCRVVFRDASPEPLEGDRRHLDETEIGRGVRLACIHQARHDCSLCVPEPEVHELLDDDETDADLLDVGEMAFDEDTAPPTTADENPAADLDVTPADSLLTEDELAGLDDLH